MKRKGIVVSGIGLIIIFGIYLLLGLPSVLAHWNTNNIARDICSPTGQHKVIFIPTEENGAGYKVWCLYDNEGRLDLSSPLIKFIFGGIRLLKTSETYCGNGFANPFPPDSMFHCSQIPIYNKPIM